MRKATSSSADDGKSASRVKLNPERNQLPEKAAIGKQAAAAEPTAKVPALPLLGQRIAEAKKLEALDCRKASDAEAKETKTSVKGLALATSFSGASLRMFEPMQS